MLTDWNRNPFARALGGSPLPVLIPALLLITALLLPAPLRAAGDDAPSKLLDKPAPLLMGQGLMTSKLVNIKKLRSEVEYLKDAEGKLVKDDKGALKKEVTNYAQVLNFFATYCVPCVKEIPTFNRITETYKGRKVQFYYVNVDVEKTKEEVAQFAKAKGIAVEMVFPSVKYAMKAYDIDALPRIVVIDGDGVIRKVIRGFHEDLAAQMDDVLSGVIPAN